MPSSTPPTQPGPLEARGFKRAAASPARKGETGSRENPPGTDTSDSTQTDMAGASHSAVDKSPPPWPPPRPRAAPPCADELRLVAGPLHPRTLPPQGFFWSRNDGTDWVRPPEIDPCELVQAPVVLLLLAHSEMGVVQIWPWKF